MNGKPSYSDEIRTMHHSLFISDLHLDEKHQLSSQFFNNFMEKQAPLADAVYILGDFFELWIGDDDCNPFSQKIKNSLKILSEKKIPIYFLHGNRDFLVGKRFERETGCKILPEFSVIQLYGESIILLHGDALCSLDSKHMKFRKLSQNTLLRLLFLTLPLKIRRKIGEHLRGSSRKHHVAISRDFLDVIPSTVSHILRTNQVNHMIHGHIHNPKVFNFLLDQKPAERIVLGAWEQHGCALKWYANGKREMIFFK